MLHHFLRAIPQASPAEEIEYIGFSSAVQTSGASVTCSVPSGAVAGDLLIAFANQIGSTTQYTMTPPSGWIETVDTRGYFSGYISNYDGTTSTYTFTKSNTAADPQIIMVAFRNAAFDVQGAVSASGSASPTAPAVTLSENESCVLACFINLQNSYPLSPARSFSTPTNYTEILDTDNSLAVFYRTNMSAGSSGTVQSTATTGTLNRGFLIGLKPA
jgi:hypothetical protein